MDTHTIYDFYRFVERIFIACTFVLAVILFFGILAFINCCDFKTDKKELIYCIVIAILFIGCLSCGVYMNYLQIH